MNTKNGSLMAVRRDAAQDTTFDESLLVLVFVVLAFSAVLVASASIEVANRAEDNPFYLLTRHLVYLAVSVAGGVVVAAIPIDTWRRCDKALVFLVLLLLVAVLVPGVGERRNGSMRWLPLAGFSLQPSEFAKITVILFVARAAAASDGLFDSRRALGTVCLVIGLVLGLLMLEPDFGSVVVIAGSVTGLVLIAGMPMRQFIPMSVASFGLIATLAVLKPYILTRLLTFLDPWEFRYTSGYQLTQALIAFGRGEWFGVGLGNSIQKLFYLPEAHTDFIFSIVAEELGIVGATILLLLLFAIVLKGMMVGRRALENGMAFGAYLAFGISLLFACQTAINVGVNLGLLPTKGLTLPLVSFGGNSLMVCVASVAMLLRVDYETRMAAGRGGPR